MEKIKPKIIIADDESYILVLLKNYLSAEYEVITASDGVELLEKVKIHKPDLIITDVMMPKMDGFTACRHIKEDPDTKLIPVVILTALGNKQNKMKGLNAGADEFLPKPFDGAELKLRVRSLIRIKSLYDEVQRKNDILNNILSKYLSQTVSHQILEDPEKYLKLGGETREATIVFADIRGFTSFSENKSAQEIVSVLNITFTELVRAILEYNGTFDKFMGDSIMAIYGAPISYKDDTLRAIKTAITMQKIFSGLQNRMGGAFIEQLGLGIGINTGEVVIGNIGSEKFMDYTAIGDNVNIAKRIEELTGRGEIIISETTYQKVKDWITVEAIGSRPLKGKSQPIELYKVRYIV